MATTDPAWQLFEQRFGALRRARRGIGEAAINQISDIFPAPPKAIVATPVNELV